ncbi:MAG TPA: hypothetical protein VGR22_07550, partial [Thermomicrobiales bacterium]|nr:hypothetical protein [Thermomicrobiales bacterium]
MGDKQATSADLGVACQVEVPADQQDRDDGRDEQDLNQGRRIDVTVPRTGSPEGVSGHERHPVLHTSDCTGSSIDDRTAGREQIICLPTTTSDQ